MAWELVFDPLFRWQLVTGLALSLLLPVLGAYLHLRREWLAALGLSHVAAAGAVAGAALAWPVLPAALGAAGIAAAIKGALQRAGNPQYAVMILFGWAATLIVASLSRHGELVGQALVDGQLYFTGPTHLGGALAISLAAAVVMSWLSPRLIRSRFFPDYFAANGLPGWRHHVIFDVLVVAALVFATTAMGIMGAFALVFVPPWVAFSLVRGWRRALMASAGLGATAYVIAFVLAVGLDQPFGPILVLAILVTVLLRAAVRPIAVGD